MQKLVLSPQENPHFSCDDELIFGWVHSFIHSFISEDDDDEECLASPSPIGDRIVSHRGLRKYAPFS